MAGDEHESKEIVADVVVKRRFEIGDRPLLVGLQLASDLLVLPIEARASPQVVDRAMLGGGHQPGAGVVRDARVRPLLERGDEGVLREILRQTYITNNPRQAGDELGGFDSPDRVNRAMCIGSRHGYQSHHLSTLVQGWW
jgi:hypothetical protein